MSIHMLQRQWALTIKAQHQQSHIPKPEKLENHGLSTKECNELHAPEFVCSMYRKILQYTRKFMTLLNYLQVDGTNHKYEEFFGGWPDLELLGSWPDLEFFGFFVI